MSDPIYETEMRHEHCNAEITRLRTSNAELVRRKIPPPAKHGSVGIFPTKPKLCVMAMVVKSKNGDFREPGRKTMTFQNHTIFTSPNGQFRVAALLANGLTAITDPNRYASEAAANIAAKKAHFEKPYINYTVVSQ